MEIPLNGDICGGSVERAPLFGVNDEELWFLALSDKPFKVALWNIVMLSRRSRREPRNRRPADVVALRQLLECRPSARRRRASFCCCGVSFGGRPMCWPRALARSRPSAVRVLIRSRSMSASLAENRHQDGQCCSERQPDGSSRSGGRKANRQREANDVRRLRKEENV